MSNLVDKYDSSLIGVTPFQLIANNIRKMNQSPTENEIMINVVAVVASFIKI